MIDGLFKKNLDQIWDRIARPLARVLTANQVTVGGLLLVIFSSGLFYFHQKPWIYAICLAIAFASDSLDGAVARLRKESSHFGGYLDAIVDRYQELIVFISIALYAGAWPAALLAFSGSILTSYAKARAAVEIQIDNNNWPDLFERQERIIFMCVLLIIESLFGQYFLTIGVLQSGLWLLALLTHFTAIQRFNRARGLLEKIDQDRKGDR